MEVERTIYGRKKQINVMYVSVVPQRKITNHLPRTTSDSQRMTSKRDIETTPHHSATPNTETPPNSASMSGPSKTTTPSTLFPGAFSHRTRRTTAQAKDVTSASKKNY